MFAAQSLAWQRFFDVCIPVGNDTGVELLPVLFVELEDHQA